MGDDKRIAALEQQNAQMLEMIRALRTELLAAVHVLSPRFGLCSVCRRIFQLNSVMEVFPHSIEAFGLTAPCSGAGQKAGS